jgi:hypothetical protein
MILVHTLRLLALGGSPFWAMLQQCHVKLDEFVRGLSLWFRFLLR